eukprot:TRINITY_DN4202_c0_g2_i1.p1 TRINITY_DN4202_c0_g2~~TRINITY_DN4202_c0_g2_i1.p1  ORF type:complete len:996 (-),score=260.21 TRINITY_DN4202_c0_g2_i1:117-3104(-)
MLATVILVLFLIGLVPDAPATGAQSYGNPVADPAAVVTAGNARFTVLTDRLIRLEYRTLPFEDRQTMVVWNRRLPVPPFANSTDSDGVLQIKTASLVLTYTGVGDGFTADNLKIQLLTPGLWSNGSVWTPAINSSGDPGNLFGTFHTLDTLSGPQDLNCTNYVDGGVPPGSTGLGDAPFGPVPFYPCVLGLVSRSGWAVVDDSRTPVLADGWIQPQLAGTCAAPSVRVPCFPGMYNMADQGSCENAGCCWDYVPPPPTLLNLYYSSEREDHFTDATCSGCAGNGYTLVRPQGYAFADQHTNGTIPLNLYWNPAPGGALKGSTGDNVVSTFPPSQPGYSFVRVQGYIYDVSLPQPPDTVTVKLWYKASALDHYTTAGPADEQDAAAAGFVPVATLGYMPPPYATTERSAGVGASNGSVSCFQRAGNADWYFLGHGLDYAQALYGFSRIAGYVPIPRRHFLGVSWSRWGSLDQNVTYGQVLGLENASFPLDTYIFDMNWHLKPAWDGYTWDTTLYWDHVGLIQWMHERGLYTGANLHDADGVQDFELRYPQMAVANGIDPSTGENVAFRITNKTYADSLHSVVLAPLAAEGLDFWWTDFQQGIVGVQDVTGVTPTMVLNHYRFTNYSGSERRGLIHSRFGGLGGSHRYPTGFGGDVGEDWPSLAFMVPFTATATNVLFGYWGHEMMRNGGNPTDNTELFLRFIQFGAWSPVYTNWGNSGSDDNLWLMPQPYQAAAQRALADRNQLLPYRYSLAKIAFDTGLGPVRPMYYAYPTLDDAYSAPGQYMLGPDIIVCPVVTPVDANTGLATVSVWLPPGSNWYSWSNTTIGYQGDQWISSQYSIDDVPVFVRANAVLTKLPYADAIRHGSASRPYASLEFVVFPGPANAGNATVYEDDGLSEDYLRGVYAYTTMVHNSADKCTTFIIQTAGNYTGLPTSRFNSIFALSSPTPATVTANGKPLPESATDAVPGTWFRANDDTRVYLPAAKPLVKQTVVICSN